MSVLSLWDTTNFLFWFRVISLNSVIIRWRRSKRPCCIWRQDKTSCHGSEWKWICWKPCSVLNFITWIFSVDVAFTKFVTFQKRRKIERTCIWISFVVDCRCAIRSHVPCYRLYILMFVHACEERERKIVQTGRNIIILSNRWLK